MNDEQLIELTKDLIYHATHFDVPYVKDAYADKLLIVKVDENGVVDTMNKEQLLNFIQGNKDANAEPISSKTEYHYAVCEENMGMVVITRELVFDGKLNRKFFTLFWEYLSGRWQIVKESAVVRS
ncbi:hypothetical protein SAMN05518672_101187 [Chitinophaga sp. CF118]|uniref:hypothetical protein n=1 Tax=Chitinophaga sp. CF118 TaxID=1884367 RepID=UPI0008E220CA|nr:hypothetical protein [Chitinophaga sp. CF118]SFD04421.1 hypothetical protein SAMN05518672_101187 [Chitinophaga sp. CF118]